jgi:transglutaminase-like putative cysteine protease
MLRPIPPGFSATTIALRLRLVCCAAVLAAAIHAAADDPGFTVAPPGSWVKPQFYGQVPAPQVESTEDDRLLLLEHQVNALQNETFHHTVRQVLTLAGVQKEANLSLDFDPTYQSLTLHWARIWRGAQHLDRLDASKVKVIQAERDADQFILDGKKTAILVLDDVTVGDIIDYSYSLKGTNPVFAGHFSSTIPVQMEQPAGRLFTRVLWPTQRHLFAKPHGCSVSPTAVAGKEAVEYTWDFQQVPGLSVEDLLPAWYDPQPWVQLSEFKTWAEVNQWALALFQLSTPVSPALAAKIADWRQISDSEQRVLAALRFVQDDVRYFGIEIGSSSEKPTDPSTVLSRRFGDCKDKSLLFVTILRALGIPAYPVLVNTAWGRGIADWHPSAGIFDHCIAVVQCNGQTYFLDPTMNYQRGPLAAHYLPAYGCGLMVTPATTGLSLIPQTTGLPRTTTTEYFQLRGKSQPSDLKVVTVADGRAAEDLRQLFAETKRSDIEKNHTHFYADSYPGIRLSTPIVVQDDEQQNRFQIVESYAIDDAWTKPDKGHKFRCDFYPLAIAAELKKPVDTTRQLPLGVSFPEHQIVRTEVTLPDVWPAEADKKTVSDSAFLFQKASRCAGNKLVMEYEYQALADSVAPDRVPEYLQHLNQTQQALGYDVISR